MIPTSTTHAAANTQHLNANPKASGGGCDVWRYSANSDIRAQGCTSAAPLTYVSDGYVYFFPSSTVSSCQVSILIYDTNNNLLASQSWDCTSAANSHAQYKHYASNGGLLACRFYTEIFVSMQYTNHAGSWVGSDSPVLSAQALGC